MATIKLGEQLIFLRKQKKTTQEELANVLGVTNQAVSKWESGACCPDIALLPDIAAYFNVTVDELLGYKPADSFNDVYLKIKGLFQAAPIEDCFELAYKLAFVLHEGAMSKGYKGYIPWDSNKNRVGDDDFYKWGFSACSEPEGVTVMKGNAVFISSNKQPCSVKQSSIWELHNTLRRFENINTLRVVFGLYELMGHDSEAYVPLEKIAAKCMLPVDQTESVLNDLPLEIKPLEDGKDGYRIEGCFLHIPAILMLLML